MRNRLLDDPSCVAHRGVVLLADERMRGANLVPADGSGVQQQPVLLELPVDDLRQGRADE